MSYRFRNRRPRPSRSQPGPRAAALPPPPEPAAGPARSRPGPRVVLCQLLVCLTVTVGLSSAHLEATAASLPFGPERSVALAVTRPLHRLAMAGGLDRPDRAVGHLLGRAPDDQGPALPPVDGTRREEAAIGLVEAAGDPAAGGVGGGPAGSDPAGGAAADASMLHGPPRPADGSGAPPPAAPETPVAPGPAGDQAGTGVSATTDPARPTPAVALAPGLGPDVVDPVPDREPAPARAVTPEARLRLWAGGDSLGEYVGNQLLAPLSNRDLTAVELDFHIGTGLTRPDAYDWAARIDEVMARPEPPEALVFMVGGNDNQPMRAGGENLAVGSEPWLAEYRARVVDLMDSTRPPDPGRSASHLWWIGLPPMRDGERDGLARSIDAIVAEEAAGRPWVTFVDLMPRFSGPDGGFAGTLAGPDGTTKVARAPDGIHITYAGSTWIAQDLWADIVARWRLPAS
ncbi:MAG: hypothetical protein R2761_02040 [Acidimicrobiales bacterium]